MCHCHVLMAKYVSKTTDMMDSSWLSELIIKNTQKTKQKQQQEQQTATILIITYKSFLIKDILLFFYKKSLFFFFCQSIRALSHLWLRISNLKNANHLKDN